MTTTVSIKHMGPEHHDVVISTVNPTNGDTRYATRLSLNEQTTLSLWGSQSLVLTEVPKKEVEVKNDSQT